jgi:hypothetical protein
MALQPLRYLCALCASAVSLIFESHSTANRYKRRESSSAKIARQEGNETGFVIYGARASVLSVVLRCFSLHF